MPRLPYSPRQLLEMQACTNCRACAEVCPAVRASGEAAVSGVRRLAWQKRACRAASPWTRWLPGRRPPSDRDWAQFAPSVYRCTLCGNCAEVCPSGIGLKDLWLALRQDLVSRGVQPEKTALIKNNLATCHNVFAEDQQDRCEWVEDMDEAPGHGFIRPQAEVVYFTGCVASFFPLAQQIPIALAEILQAAEVDFTLLGEEEWCCGFPLLGAGMLSQARELMEHNLAAVRAKGARQVVFACPSCYMMWREHYPTDLELIHETQFLERLIQEGRLPLKQRELSVTYHDPCDLGRGARVFEEPRRVIASLPGVRLQEMAESRESCQCCGGGGNLEMIDQKLNAEISRRKIEQVQATGAQAVVSACQQCLRTMATHIRRHKLPIQVLDIAQLVR
ncbi:MAG: (Fe-S)-binding protein, partial [Thermodesulfobacteriota bacterium]